MKLADVRRAFEDGSVPPGAFMRYFFCDAHDGKFWIEMQIEGLREPVQIGPFDTEEDRQGFFDQMQKIIADHGGKTHMVQ